MKASDNRILYKDTFLYRGVSLVNIDRSYDSMYWINRHGLVKIDTVMDFNSGAWFDIYENRQLGLATAIPV